MDYSILEIISCIQLDFVTQYYQSWEVVIFIFVPLLVLITYLIQKKWLLNVIEIGLSSLGD